MIKNKSKIIIASIISVCIVVAAVTVLIVCLAVFGNKTEMTEQDRSIGIAKTDFGLDEILSVSELDSGAANMDFRYTCVIGRKDGEDVWVAVPRGNDIAPFVMDCLFDYSYSEILTRANRAGADMPEHMSDDYKDRVYLYAPEYQIENYAKRFGCDGSIVSKIDVPAALVFTKKGGYSMITQESGKLILYSWNSDQNKSFAEEI